MFKIKTCLNYKQLFVFAVFLFVGLYFVLNSMVDLCIDDYWYCSGTCGVDDRLEATKIVWQNCVDHWSYDTGRLANLVSPPFLALFPKWVFALCNAFMMLVTIKYSLKLANIAYGSMKSWVLLFVYVFMLPWNDHMVSTIYALNYVWGLAMCVYLIYVIVGIETDKLHYSKCGFIFVCFFAILTGWMHEGYSAPMVCSLIAYFVIARRLPKRASTIVIIAFLAGFALILCSDAFWAGNGLYTRWKSTLFFYRSVALYLNLSIVLALSLVVVLLGKKWRSRAFENADNAALISLLAVFGISTAVFIILVCHGPREAFPAQFFSILTLLVLIDVFDIQKRISVVKKCFVSLVILGISVNMFAAIYYQSLLNKEFAEIKELYLKSVDGVVYYDIISDRFNLALNKTTHDQFKGLKDDNNFCIQLFSRYYCPNKPMLNIRPSCEAPNK